MRPLLVVFERVARDCSLSATGQGRGTWRIGFDSLGDAISTAALQRSRGRSRCRVIASLSSSRIQYCGGRSYRRDVLGRCDSGGPETLLVGLPFIAFGLWVASRGVARSGD